MFGNKRNDSKPGTDWSAKKDQAGSKSQSIPDRPYAEGTRSSDGELGDWDVTTNPGNPVD